METALITGASGGLGEAFARLCAADKMDLILVARSKEKLEALATELSAAHGITVHVITADLSKSGSATEIAADIDRTATPITLLINNAGAGTQGAFVKGDLHDQEGMMRLNMESLMVLTRLILPGMVERKHGRILNVASIAAFLPGPFMAIYYATKAFVLNFSLALSNELQGTGVTVTCLCPGPTQTGFAAHAGAQNKMLFKGPLMDATSVAYAGYRACMQGKSLITPGAQNKMLVFLTRLIPRMTAAAAARSIQA